VKVLLLENSFEAPQVPFGRKFTCNSFSLTKLRSCRWTARLGPVSLLGDLADGEAEGYGSRKKF